MSVTFQPPSKSLSPRDYQFIALAVLGFLLVGTALIIANLKLQSGGGDFYVEWVGARAFLFDKVDPYSGEIPARVQRMVYAGPAVAGQEPYILDLPFQLLPLYYPFALFSDPKVARALFTLVLELALVALALLALQLTDWRPPRIFGILFVLFVLFNFYTFEAVHESSAVLIAGLAYVAILFALRAGLDELAGALAALSLCFWAVGAPFLVLVLLRVYNEKRTRVFAGFFMLCFLLFFISFLSYPNWIIPFLQASVNNLRADFGFDLHKILVQLWPSQGGLIAWTVVSLLLVLLAYEFSSIRSGDERHFYWSACLSLAVAPFLGLRSEFENLAVLVIPLALILAVVHDRWQKFGAVVGILLMLAIFMVPWAASQAAVHGSGAVTQDFNFLFLPLITIIGLYWIRWWAIRPPRTWKDLASQP